MHGFRRNGTIEGVTHGGGVLLTRISSTGSSRGGGGGVSWLMGLVGSVRIAGRRLSGDLGGVGGWLA